MKKLLFALLLLLPLHTEAQSRLLVATNLDKISVPGSVETIDATNSYSVWISTASQPAGLYSFYSEGAGAAQPGIILSYMNNGGTKQIRVATAGSFGNYCLRYYSVTLTDGQWNHIAVTIDGSLNNTATDVKVYANGTILAQQSSSGPNWGANASYYGNGRIGATYWGTDIEYFDGRISKLAQYKTVLNQSQITALARGARFDRITPPENLVQAWRVDGMSPEQDSGPSHFVSSAISGTTVVTGPPTVPR